MKVSYFQGLKILSSMEERQGLQEQCRRMEKTLSTCIEMPISYWSYRNVISDILSRCSKTKGRLEECLLGSKHRTIESLRSCIPRSRTKGHRLSYKISVHTWMYSHIYLCVFLPIVFLGELFRLGL